MPGIQCKALCQRAAEQLLAQAQRGGQEQASIHGLQAGADAGMKSHMGQHIAFQVHPGASSISSSAPLPPGRCGDQTEHAAFGHIQDPLATFERFGAAEGAMFDGTHELARAPFVRDAQLSISLPAPAALLP